MASGFDDLFKALEGVNEEIVSLNAELVLLGERVTILEEGGLSSPIPGAAAGTADEERVPGAPVVWDELGAEERVALWPKFVAWVIWAADHYEMTNDQLPRQCWWLHGAVVEELTALWTSHQSAYAPGEDAGSAPYLWQDAVARALERIGRLWIGGCRNGQHRSRHRQAWAGDASYLATFLTAEDALLVTRQVAARSKHAVEPPGPEAADDSPPASPPGTPDDPPQTESD